MKKYAYRGWLNLLFVLLGVLIAVAGLCASDTSYLVCVFTVSVPQLVQFAGQRALSEQQWKQQRNNADERHKQVVYRAGALAAAVTETLTGGLLLYAAFREYDSFTLGALCAIFTVCAITFSIAQLILDKKL